MTFMTFMTAMTILVGLTAVVAARADDKPASGKPATKVAAKPALTVTLTTPQRAELPLAVPATASL